MSLLIELIIFLFVLCSYFCILFRATRIDEFARQQPGLEGHLRNLSQGLTKYLERYTEIYERDLQRLGELYAKFQTALQLDTTTPGKFQDEGFS